MSQPRPWEPEKHADRISLKRQSVFAPRSHDSGTGTLIKVYLGEFEILSIDNWEEQVSVMFHLYLAWKDTRLTYSDLKSTPFLNTLYYEHAKMVWTPNIAFSPANKLLTSEQMEAENPGLVLMLKKGNFTLNEKSELVKRRIYRGDENDLVKKSYCSVDFICSFDLFWYPFLFLF